jgi:tetrahedral aminopeptidase
MVTHIDDDGFLSVAGIGGWDAQVLPGQRLRILTRQGLVLGVVGRKPIHLLKEDDRKKGVEIVDLWIDIGAKNKADAASVVMVGDPAVLDYGFATLRNDIVAARGFDDRVGAFVVLEAARKAARMDPKACIYAVATVQEEIGLRGAITAAYAVKPTVGIAVDVAHTTDTPGMKDDRKRIGECVLGGGPTIARGPNINGKLFDLLTDTAGQLAMRYQIEPAPRGTGTDANVMQISRSGVAAALVSVPNRYMHSPCEIVHLGDLDACSTLVAHVVARIDDDTSFVLD